MTGGGIVPGAAAITGPFLHENGENERQITWDATVCERESKQAGDRNECSELCNNPLTLDTVGLDLEEFDWR